MRLFSDLNHTHSQHQNGINTHKKLSVSLSLYSRVQNELLMPCVVFGIWGVSKEQQSNGESVPCISLEESQIAEMSDPFKHTGHPICLIGPLSASTQLCPPTFLGNRNYNTQSTGKKKPK